MLNDLAEAIRRWTKKKRKKKPEVKIRSTLTKDADCREILSWRRKQTSPSSLVSDTVRRIDYQAARFSRLLGTLPMQADTTGLKLADSDMQVVLLKSLPETVKNYVLHTATQTTASPTGTLRCGGKSNKAISRQQAQQEIELPKRECGTKFS